MYRNLALGLLPLALFLAACGGGDSNDASQQDSQDGPPASVSDSDSDADDGGLSLADDGSYQFTDDGSADDAVTQDGVSQDGVSADDDLALSDGADTTGDFDVLGAVNPLQFLGGLDTASLSLQAVDPSLTAALLTTADLPGLQSFGDFSFAMPSEFGDIEMAARMFVDGDLASEDFDTMVMSAAMVLPPGALAQMGDLEDFSGLTDEDLAEIEGFSSEFGASFIDFSVLDASGLGDGGFGMHIEMDFAALLEGFGPVEGDESMPDGIAADMYMFFAGERAFMVMVMWPTNVSPTADALDLAEIMDSRA